MLSLESLHLIEEENLPILDNRTLALIEDEYQLRINESLVKKDNAYVLRNHVFVKMCARVNGEQVFPSTTP